MRGTSLRLGLRTAVLLASSLLATPVQGQPDAAAILQGLRVNRARAIDFHAARFPDTVYVGEQVTYQVAVLLSESARARLRRNPEFVPPEFRGMLAFELGRPVRRTASAEGTPYEAFVFQRALFPVVAGRLTIPAPSLTYTLPQSASYFSPETRESVRAESLEVVVRPLPEAGRPARFAGAIGRLSLSTRFDATGVQVGTPVVVTVRVEGRGNVRLMPRPELELPWGEAVAGTERVMVDTAGPWVRGHKEFDWILTPAVAGVHQLPVIRYPVFDPEVGAYQVMTTEPVAVTVAPGAVVPGARDPEAVAPVEPLRRWIATTPVPMASGVASAWRWWLAGILLPPLLAGVAWRRRPGRRPAPGQRGGARVEPLPPILAAEPPTAAALARQRRRRLLDGVAARLHVPQEALVGREGFARTLRHHGVSREVTALALALRDQLEVEGFGEGGGTGADGLVGRAADDAVAAVLTQLDAEAVGPSRGAAPRAGGAASWRLRRGVAPMGTLVAGVLAMGLPAAVSSWAGPSQEDTPLTARAVAAKDAGGGRTDAASDAAAVAAATGDYDARRYRAAADGFAALVRRRPQDVALLANWGTAAWAASDTVSAVVAWQRAARLQPWAADLQRHLTRLPVGARAGLAQVPLVPVALLWTGGAVAWLVGWSWMAWGWWRGRRTGWPAPGALVLVLVALALWGWGTWGHRKLSAAGLAVVVRPETLHSAPTVASPAAGGVGTGDVVVAAPPQDGWRRVRHADGRTGWLPAVRLRPLLPAARSD
jgi:hypothetical protein